MRNNTPDQPTPEQEQNEEQSRQREEHPLSSQNSAAAGPDVSPDSAPDRQPPPPPDRPSSEAGLRQGQEVSLTENSEENAAQGPEPEAADETETPLSMQPEAAQAQTGPAAIQDAGEDDARKFEFEAEQDQAAEEKPEQGEPEQKTEASPEPEDGPVPSKTFSGLSWITPLMLLLLAALLFAPLAYHSKVAGIAPQPDISSRLAAAVDAAREGDLGAWFVPQIAGQPAPEVPPVQLWWSAAMGAADHALTGLAGPWLAGWFEPFMLTWLFLMAAASLGWTDSRFGRKAALAAGIAAFCSRPFIGAAWFAPEMLLAPTLSVMAAACLLRGLKKNEFSMAVFVGCALMALAALAGGVILAALPLAAVLLTIVGTLNFRRLGEWDLVFGLGVTALILGSWLTGGLLFAGSSALRAYLAEAPLLFGGVCPLPETVPGGLALLSITALLPWLALPLLMPARSCKALLGGVKSWKNRTGFTEPLFLGGMLVAGIAGLAAGPGMQPALLPALAAALAALAARSLTNLTPGQNRRWGAFCALYLLILASVFFWMLLDSGRQFFNAQLGIAANISFDLKVWLAPGTAALIGALTMWFFGRSKSSQTGLLALLFAMLLITQAFAWFSIPVMAPYLKATTLEPPVMDIVSPEMDLAPGPRLNIPFSPELPVITPPAVAANATQEPPVQTQPYILGAPIPVQHNTTTPNALPGLGSEIPANTTARPPESGVPGGEVNPPPTQNSTGPVPEAGNALYGDDLPPLETTTTGPPPTPYQPGLHSPQPKEPPLPLLDTPRAP